MKRTIAKIMGLALVLALTLTGCNLIKIDEVMQANEDIAKTEKAYAVSCATYDGGEVTAAEAVADFNAQYSYMAQMYAYYLGTNITNDQVQEIALDTLQAKVEDEIVAKHFDDDGNTLTEEQMASVQAAADEDYESIHTEALGVATGSDEAGKEANVQVLLTEVGQTKDQIYAAKLQAEKVTQMKNILCEQISELSDEALQTAYEARVESDRETYTNDPARFGTDKTSATEDTVICYVPEGYRTVRHILVIPEEDVLNAYTDAKSALTTAEQNLANLENEMAELEGAEDASTLRTAEEIQADIDAANAEIDTCKANVTDAAQACLANVSAKTGEIYTKLAEEGATFEAIMNEYGEDPGMQDEANAKTGYYVCADSTNWQPEFTEGAMALANVGDYSAEPVVSGSGVHIIEYFTDVKSGEVPLAEIHDALYAQALTEAQETNRDETIAAWVSEANPSYDAAALVTAVTASDDHNH